MGEHEMRKSRNKWRKACRFLYDVTGEGGSRGRPMDLIPKRSWQRLVRLIGDAESQDDETNRPSV